MNWKAWNQLWENYDVYLGLAISILGAFLTLFDLVPEKIVSVSILGLLSIIAITILRERHLREEMRKDIVLRLSSERSWYDLQVEMEDRLMNASKIRFLGISPLGLLRKYRRSLEDVLKKGGEIWFIVVDPDSAAMELIRQGRPENFNDGRLFLEEICQLFGNYIQQNYLKIKLINYIPNAIVTMIDEDNENGIIFATLYSFKQVDPYRPSRLITRREGLLYSFFQSEFYLLWDSTEKYHKCQKLK